MTDKCFDIGTIQAFLDGELASERTETVACHISACDDCAMLLANAEEETAFVFSTLEQEFNTLVPTQRLWTKINDSIEQERKSFWKPIFVFLLKPSTTAFASLLFVAVVSITLLSLKPDAPTVDVAQKSESRQTVIQPKAANMPPTFVESSEIKSPVKIVAPVASNQNKSERLVVKTSLLKNERTSSQIEPSTKRTDYVIPKANETVLGEETYIKTIATLTETVNTRKDETLNSSARFSFERDLAVTNDAIAKMKKEVKRNPNNEAAKDILRASYQNKIDLLNSVADKTELMASLK